MATVVHVVIPGVTPAQYDAIRAETGWLETPPVGGLAHMTWWEGDDCHNMDAWADEAAFAAFGEQRLGPAIAKLGIEAEVIPAFHEAHEVFLPKPVTALAT